VGEGGHYGNAVFAGAFSGKWALRKRLRGVLYRAAMKTLEQVESDVRMLPPEKQEELRDWLENMLEEQLEFTDEFKAKIERGEQDIREGRSRIRKP
jgi:predicted nuclease with TOPRIM domain